MCSSIFIYMAGSRLEVITNEDGIWIFADEEHTDVSKLMSLATLEKGPVTIHRITRGGAKSVHHTYLVNPRSRYVRVKDAWMDWWAWPTGKTGWPLPPASVLWVFLAFWTILTVFSLGMVFIAKG